MLLEGSQVQIFKLREIKYKEQSWKKFCESSLHIFYYIIVTTMMRLPNLGGTLDYGCNLSSASLTRKNFEKQLAFPVSETGQT